ncbi:MAG: riboflavin synthase [Rickettsiaceae bacterium H1]|nr:riboflavin synthase [Rickettsiaceae bacterium H1]
MFNGVINFIGTIIDKNKNYFQINTPLSFKTEIGESIACSGVCLTVIKLMENSIVFEVSDATLSCTNLGKWKSGAKVNLEPSLKVGDRIDGHFVLGHVDTTVNIKSLSLLKDGSHKLTIEPNLDFMKYITYKGSVALDGVSLTVNEVKHDKFFVNLLPYTFENTTFQYNKPGDRLNMEVDVLARYVNKAIHPN